MTSDFEFYTLNHFSILRDPNSQLYLQFMHSQKQKHSSGKKYETSFSLLWPLSFVLAKSKRLLLGEYFQ